MKYRVEVGLVFFLLLFLISMGDPLVHAGAILRRLPGPEKSAGVECLTQVVPAGARVLFLSNIDGTVDWNAYNFVATRTQYDLAPRVVVAVPDGQASVDLFPYLLAYNMDSDALAQVSSRYQRLKLQTCDHTTVFGPLH